MQLVAGAVQEAGVDERHPAAGGVDAGLEVGRGAPLLVHDAELDRAAAQPEQVLDGREEIVGEADLVGSVHLRLHGVHRRRCGSCASSPRPWMSTRLHSAVSTASRMPFRHLLARRCRRIASEVIRCPTWRTNSSERPGQHDLAAPERAVVDAVRLEAAGERRAALGHLRGQRAPVEEEPVAVARDLVVGVDRGDRVLEVHDRGDRGLQEQVLDPRRVVLADLVGAVDLDLDVQPVVDQEHALGLGRVAAVADVLAGVGQRRRAGRRAWTVSAPPSTA